jgi:hypothetical protein
MIPRRILLGMLVGAVLTAAPVRVFAICYGINMHVLTPTGGSPHYGTVVVTISGQANIGTYTLTGFNPGPGLHPGDIVNASGMGLQCLSPNLNFAGPPRFYGTWTISGHADDGSWYVYGTATLGGQCCGCDGCATPVGYTDFFLDTADHSTPPGVAVISAVVQVPANCAVGHQVALRYNGSVVARDTTPSQNRVPYTSRIGISKSPANNGDTYDLEVDGVIVAQGVVTLRNAGSPEHPLWEFSDTIMGTVNCTLSGPPGGTPTPTATPIGAATPVGAPAPAGTPGSVRPSTPQSGGPAGFASDVIVDNTRDIYGPITDRLDRVLDTSGLTEPVIEDADLSQRGHLDDLQGKMDGLTTTVNNAVSDTTSHMASLAGSITANWSSASFGSVGEFDLPLSLFHAGFPASIAVPSFASTIRSVILWLLVACWYWLAARSIMALTPAK